MYEQLNIKTFLSERKETRKQPMNYQVFIEYKKCPQCGYTVQAQFWSKGKAYLKCHGCGKIEEAFL